MKIKFHPIAFIVSFVVTMAVWFFFMRPAPLVVPIQIGMTPEQVVQLKEWGKPSKIETWATRTGTSVEWLYYDFNVNSTVWFDGGKVSRIDARDNQQVGPPL